MLRQGQGVDFGPQIAHLLGHHPLGQPQEPPEGRFQRLIALGFMAEIANSAAKIGLERPELSFGAFVLFGVGIVLMLGYP